MKSFRIYVITQLGCSPCEHTLKVLGKDVEGVPVYEIDVSASKQRRDELGFKSTPTISLVEVYDKNGNGIEEEIEETPIWHQSGMIADKTNLEHYVRVLRSGGSISTNI